MLLLSTTTELIGNVEAINVVVAILDRETKNVATNIGILIGIPYRLFRQGE